MPTVSGALLFLTLISARCISAQLAFDNPDVGKSQIVGVSCDSFAPIAMEFLHKQGMKLQQDWSCGSRGSRCIVTKSSAPMGIDGRVFSREEVVRKYLNKPAEADFRLQRKGWYWEVPDRNFTLSGSLQLRQEGTGCQAKLTLSFDMDYTQFLGILPYELYGRSFAGNGRLETEYLRTIEKNLPH